MSEPDLEEQKRALLPYMQRAQEMQKADPKLAYYCRMYAVEQAFKFDKRAPAINDLVSAALGQMEKDKPSLGLDKAADRYHCEGVALKIFANADKADRAGKATIATAKAYLAASYFLDVLNHFEPVDGDILEKQKWSFWRAAEIRKAIREGRDPLPPAGSDVSTAGEGGLGGGQGAGGGGSGGADDSDAFLDLPAAPAVPPGAAHSSSGGGFGGWGGSGGVSISAARVGPDYTAPQPGPPRFRPGSQVLYMAEGNEGGEPEPGTVGQVLPPGPDGWARYKVGLRDRLEEGAETRLAPRLAEGDVVLVLAPRIGGGSVGTPAHTVLMNDMAWPPTYLVRMPDGSEQAAAAEQLSLALPEGMATRAPPPAQPMQPTGSVSPPMGSMQHGGGGGGRGGEYGQPAHGGGGSGGDGGYGPPPPVGAYSSAPYSPQPYAPPPQHQAPPPQHQAPPPQHHAPPQHQAPPPARPTQAYAPAAPPPAHAPAHTDAPPPAHAGQLVPELSASIPKGHKPSLQAVLDAQKNAKYAVSSLNFEDVDAAVKYLKAAIRALTQ
ncbi:hypothetical protein FOA52_000324 [Chlamydomonas sp. UWO 241]|nr:hypothetical protein FOA52_000324 [Chlamydomonas sp. UWO 241]